MTGLDFRTWRNAHSMTQAELATRLGVTTKTIWNWEQERTHIPHAVTLALRELTMERVMKP